MIKNIIVIIAILVASIILFTSKNTSEIKGDISRRDILDYFPSLSFPPLTISGNELALSVESWTTFEKYLEFAKTHDLNGIRNLSHQISDTCNDPLREKECFALMDSVYSFASLFKQNDFNHILVDERQIIMYTDGPTVAMLYFTRNNGPIKVLGMRFCLEDETSPNSCVETDPLKRDLDSNSWWDDVESLFY